MTTKDIITALVYSASISVHFPRNGEIIEWAESDNHASLAVEFEDEVFDIEITVTKRK